MIAPPALLLAYYGDDFTGSTDALEFLTRAGARTALFIEPPTREQLERSPDLQAIGVAGMTRSLGPDDMTNVLRPAFQSLAALGVRHLHYKVCSTFDSSPTIGSIGRAIEIGAEVCPNAPVVPVVVGAPALGRYCVFGNLFGRMGIGSDGAIYRLDRHPSASRHPTTPADEADLLRHLARQTDMRIALFDILQIALPEQVAATALDELLRSAAPEIIFFDLLTTQQLVAVGRLLDRFADVHAPLFSAGSSGIEMSLGAHWNASGVLHPVNEWPDPGSVEPLLVLSGSCSPVTSSQIENALAAGFAAVALDTAAIVRGNHNAQKMASDGCREHLAAGRSVILHTNPGGDEASATAAAFEEIGISPECARGRTAERFGTCLGQVARELLEIFPLRRLLLAGGDTASYAARALGIESVEMIAPLAPGAPLCRARAPDSPADGIEVNFKGGQVGDRDYFSTVARGRVAP